jgi:hypothetical protein
VRQQGQLDSETEEESVLVLLLCWEAFNAFVVQPSGFVHPHFAEVRCEGLIEHFPFPSAL